MITFKLPSQLSALAGGQRSLSVEADTLAEAFLRLDEIAPMLRSQVFDGTGAVRAFTGVFVAGEQLAALGDGSRPLPDGSTITIVMAVAGG